MKKPTTKQRAKALRFYWLVLSIGWDAAVRYMAAERAR